jgi:FlaA1/EpsC-like NDP-sugar epimerase
MIQRIQSLLLIAAAICLSLILVYPFWEKTNQEVTKKIEVSAYSVQTLEPGADAGSWEIREEKSVIYFAVAGAVTALIALITIFLFKNRLLQMKLVALNALLIMAMIAGSSYFIYQGESALDMEIKGTFMPGYYLLLGALICNFFANRFIRKDEKLVKSVDRIR